MKAIVKHTLTVYEAIESAAKREQVGDETLLIFRGKVTELFKSTDVSMGYYTEVFRQLELQECVTMLQRGSKSVDSVIVCHRPPTEEGFKPPAKSALTDPERYANLREDVDALQTLVGGIGIADAFREVERRLDEIQKSITALEAKDLQHTQNTNSNN